ncbi:hypothetical protein A2U01_0096426, partial [Trifolium medium]|nr:hypothetical protein [Trifolium medium]
ALNAVSFGHHRVRARVASFDRNDMVARRSSGTAKYGLLQEGEGLVKEDGNHKFTKPTMHKGDDDRNVTSGSKANNGD